MAESNTPKPSFFSRMMSFFGNLLNNAAEGLERISRRIFFQERRVAGGNQKSDREVYGGVPQTTRVTVKEVNVPQNPATQPRKATPEAQVPKATRPVIARVVQTAQPNISPTLAKQSAAPAQTQYSVLKRPNRLGRMDSGVFVANPYRDDRNEFVGTFNWMNQKATPQLLPREFRNQQNPISQAQSTKIEPSSIGKPASTSKPNTARTEPNSQAKTSEASLRKEAIDKVAENLVNNAKGLRNFDIARKGVTLNNQEKWQQNDNANRTKLAMAIHKSATDLPRDQYNLMFKISKNDTENTLKNLEEAYGREQRKSLNAEINKGFELKKQAKKQTETAAEPTKPREKTPGERRALDAHIHSNRVGQNPLQNKYKLVSGVEKKSDATPDLAQSVAPTAAQTTSAAPSAKPLHPAKITTSAKGEYIQSITATYLHAANPNGYSAASVTPGGSPTGPGASQGKGTGGRGGK